MRESGSIDIVYRAAGWVAGRNLVELRKAGAQARPAMRQTVDRSVTNEVVVARLHETQADEAMEVSAECVSCRTPH